MLKLHVDYSTHFIEMSDLEYCAIAIRHFRDKDGIAYDDRWSQCQRNKPANPRHCQAQGKVCFLKDKSVVGPAKGWDVIQPGTPVGQLDAQVVKGHIRAVNSKGNPPALGALC